MSRLLLNILFVLFLFFNSAALVAQDIQLRGRVVDAYSNKPLQGISVGYDTTSVSTTTSSTGNFVLPYQRDQDQFWVWGIGYQARKIRFDTSEKYRIRLFPKTFGLNEVVIKAFQQDKLQSKVAGSVAHLDQEALTRYHNASLQPALNTIPGVRMESRGIGGSSRISIRGSKLRAPFGVRNVKVYWNHIPLTSPDGSTPIEVIDPQAIENVEIIKGPSGSMYGSGTGGVMQFESRQANTDERFVKTNNMVGNYGLLRNTLTAGYGDENIQVNAFYAHSQNDGYREQEANNSDFFRLMARAKLNEKQELKVFGFHFEGLWELPGSLSKKDYEQNPQEAVPFSIEGNASVWRRRTLLGATHDLRINSNWSHQLSIYTSITDKENPYGTSPFYNGIKYENAQGGGYRQVVNYEKSFDKISTKVSAGTEAQTELNTLREFTNDAGEPGDITENSDTRSGNFLAFVQNSWELGKGLSVTAGVSYNRLTYDHDDYFKADSMDYSNRIRFRPGWIPRLSVVKSFGQWSVYGTVSEGFSSPGLWELILPDGAINSDLAAERGTSYEMGIKGILPDARLQFEVNAYHFRLNDAILPVEQAAGNTVFGNAGATNQNGFEVVASWEVLPQKNDRKSALRITQTYVFQHYEFDEYNVDGKSLSGNRIPGIPYHEWNQIVNFRHTSGFYAYFTGRYIGKTPLENDNSAFMHDYYVIDIKVGHSFEIGSVVLDPYLGIQNLLDMRYSTFLQVNHVAQRYYNPSPGRTWFGGINLTYGKL